MIDTPTKSDMLVIKLATQMMGREDIPLEEIGERIINIGGGDIIEKGFFIWDTSGEKIYYSPNFKSIIGENVDASPQLFMDKMPTDKLQHFIYTVKENISNKNKSFFSINVRYISNLGESIDLLCVCTVIYLQDSKTFVLCTHYQN